MPGAKQTLLGAGIPSAEMFETGAVQNAPVSLLTGPGIASGEFFGTQGRVAPWQALSGAGIASSGAFGAGFVTAFPRLWEYLCLEMEAGPNAAAKNAASCNIYASQGWELVSVGGGVAYFRRKIGN